MTTPTLSNEVFNASQIHLGVLDEFIAVVQRKLSETANPFARDSLKDLLASLSEQREGYSAMIEPFAVAA